MTPATLRYTWNATSGATQYNTGTVLVNPAQISSSAPFQSGTGSWRNFMTDLYVTNLSVTAGTYAVLDGGTTIFQSVAPASAALTVPGAFTTALKGSPATNMNLYFFTAGPWTWNAAGFVASSNA